MAHAVPPASWYKSASHHNRVRASSMRCRADRWQFRRDPRPPLNGRTLYGAVPTSGWRRRSASGLRMSAFSFRSFRFRGALALCAAMLNRCSPEIGQCIALPGSSVFVLPSAVESPMDRLLAIALHGRAAFHGARVALAHARR